MTMTWPISLLLSASLVLIPLSISQVVTATANTATTAAVVGKDLSLSSTVISSLEQSRPSKVTVPNIIPSFINTSTFPSYQRGIAQLARVSLLQHPLKPMNYIWYLQWLETLYTGPQFYHVQIGAFTADDIEDPFSNFIKNGSWSAVLVEPQPRVYQRIQAQTDKYPHLFPVNAAVCPHEQDEVLFYMLHEDIDMYTGLDKRTGKQLPAYVTQMASLNKHHLLKLRPFFKQVGLHIKDYIVASRVPCWTIETLLQQQRINASSVISLSIDTEGSDDTILLSTDLSVMRPMFILFECVHWHRDRKRLSKVLLHLTRHGYMWWKAGYEIAAIRGVF